MGSSSEVVVAWWGHPQHSFCQNDLTMNTIVCHPDNEDTQIATQSTGWIEFMLSEGQTVFSCDIFSDCGKFINKCHAVHCTVAKIQIMHTIFLCTM